MVLINIAVILCYAALIALPVLSMPVDDLQPLCRMSSNDVLRIIQKSGGHQFNVVGSDASFDSFAQRHISQEGSPYGEKGKDFWMLPEESTSSNDSRMRRKLHPDQQDEHFVYKPLCKSVPTYERRFHKFPFIRATWSCERNRLIKNKKNFHIECKPIKETRPILKIKGGCQSYLSHRDEEWVHSTEDVQTGCQAVMKLSTNS